MIRVRIDSAQPFARALIARHLAGDDEIALLPSGSSADPPDVVIAVIEGENDWESMVEDSSPAELLLVADDLSLQESEEALRSGVRAIVPTDVERDVLLAAVKASAVGLMVVPSRFVQAAFPSRKANASRDELPESLTAREKEVLELLVEGLPNKIIAERLGISDHTAKFHVASILGKLGAGSRTEAVTLAIRQGIVML